MKIEKVNIEKRTYFSPEIILIILDNNISLALDSLNPPIGPGYEEELFGEDIQKYLRNNSPFEC